MPVDLFLMMVAILYLKLKPLASSSSGGGVGNVSGGGGGSSSTTHKSTTNNKNTTEIRSALNITPFMASLFAFASRSAEPADWSQ